jgi:hypothetical protein
MWLHRRTPHDSRLQGSHRMKYENVESSLNSPSVIAEW